MVSRIVIAVVAVGLLAGLLALGAGWRRIRKAGRAYEKHRIERWRSLIERAGQAEPDYVLGQLTGEIERLHEQGDRSAADRHEELRSVLWRSRSPRLEVFALSEVARSVIEEFRQLAPDRELSYTEADGSQMRVEADRELLRWCLKELHRNVMAHGGEWTRIRLEAGREGTTVALAFEDDGRGVDLAQAARLYGAFTPRRGSPGPGLGLYAVGLAIEGMKGTVKASAADGGGLVHRFRLPAPPEAGAAEPA